MIAFSFDPINVNIRRVKALAKELDGSARIVSSVRSDGTPGVAMLVVEVSDDVTGQQVQGIVDASTGVSEQDQRAWERQWKSQRAKQAITSRSPADIAHRSAIQVLKTRLMRALAELNATRTALRTTRADLRQLAQQLAASGLPITVPGPLPLPDVDVMTEEQALAAWRAQIDAELDAIQPVNTVVGVTP